MSNSCTKLYCVLFVFPAFPRTNFNIFGKKKPNFFGYSGLQNEYSARFLLRMVFFFLRRVCIICSKTERISPALSWNSARFIICFCCLSSGRANSCIIIGKIAFLTRVYFYNNKTVFVRHTPVSNRFSRTTYWSVFFFSVTDKFFFSEMKKMIKHFFIIIFHHF